MALEELSSTCVVKDSHFKGAVTLLLELHSHEILHAVFCPLYCRVTFKVDRRHLETSQGVYD